MRKQGNRRRGTMRLRIDRGMQGVRSLLRSYHLQADDGGRMRDRSLLQRLQGKIRVVPLIL